MHIFGISRCDLIWIITGNSILQSVLYIQFHTAKYHWQGVNSLWLTASKRVSENNGLLAVSFPQQFVSCYLFHVPEFYSKRPTLRDQFVLAGVVGERKWLARQHFLQPVSPPWLWPAWKNRQEHLEYDSPVAQAHLEHNSPRSKVTKTQ